MNRRDVLLATGIAGVLAAILVPFARLGLDSHHDGIMLKPALDVLSGQVLFRDTFMQYGALTAYLQVAALWLEPSLISIRYLTVAAYVVTIAVLYVAWRRFLPRSLAVLSCGFFILFIPMYESDWLGGYWVLLPWSSVYALMFQAIALCALFNVIRDKQPARWGLIVGAATAAVFWCRQPVGVVVTGSVGAIWLALHFAGWKPVTAPKRTVLRRMIAGHLLVHGGLLGSIVLTQAGPEWWYQNFVWPSKMVGSLAPTQTFSFFLKPFPAIGLFLLMLAVAAPAWLTRFKFLGSRRGLGAYYIVLAGLLAWQHDRVVPLLALREGGWGVLLPVVILVQAVVALVMVFRKGTEPWSPEYYLVAALAAFAAASLVQYYPLPDPWHAIWALAPGFGLVIHGFWRGSRLPAVAVAAVLTLALLPAVWTKFQSARRALSRPMIVLDRPDVLRGIRVPTAHAQRLDRIATIVEQVERHQPGIPSVLIGNDALFACFTRNLTNPSPYFVTWTGLAEGDAYQKRWNYINQVRPLMFLHRAHWDAVGEFYRKERYVPVVYFPEEALEIAIPQEIADALGITTYGAPKQSPGAPPSS
jgi:hypothetical protein